MHDQTLLGLGLVLKCMHKVKGVVTSKRNRIVVDAKSAVADVQYMHGVSRGILAGIAKPVTKTDEQKSTVKGRGSLINKLARESLVSTLLHLQL